MNIDEAENVKNNTAEDKTADIVLLTSSSFRV